jgi:hypothetical protein
MPSRPAVMPWGAEPLPLDNPGGELRKDNDSGEADSKLSEEDDSADEDPQPDDDGTFTLVCGDDEGCGRYRHLEATLVYTQGWLDTSFFCPMVPDTNGGESSHEDPCSWCNDTGRAVGNRVGDCNCVPGLAALSLAEEEKEEQVALLRNARPESFYENLGKSSSLVNSSSSSGNNSTADIRVADKKQQSELAVPDTLPAPRPKRRRKALTIPSKFM